MADGLIPCDTVLYMTAVDVLSTCCWQLPYVGSNQDCICDVLLHASDVLGGLNFKHCHCGTTLAACNVVLPTMFL
jgi:hypothetical protein